MGKILSWTLMHCAHWAVLYGAFVANIEGAMYVLKFFAWALAPVALLLLTDAAQEKGAQEPEKPVRAALSRVQAWATLLLLVWFGHIATAAAWGLAMACVAVYREAVKKRRAEPKPAVA